MTESFFTEDTVALKADPSVRALVQSTWRDVDSGGYSRPSDFLDHSGVSLAIVKQCFREGQVPPGYVLISFIDPDLGSTLVHESALTLADRTLTVGDIVKRKSSEATSGIVIKTSLTCVLEPVYNGLPYHGSEPWDHRPEDNLLTVPSEELQYLDFELEDRVIFRDWMGEVIDVLQEVSMRLGNGSVVKVHDANLLEQPTYIYSDEFRGSQPSLVFSLERGRKRRNETDSIDTKVDSAARPTSQPSILFPGQTVLTTKANLRLGHWTIGSYDPHVQPRGIVVDVRVHSIRVDWLATKIGDRDRTDTAPPDEVIDSPELEEVRLYNRHNLTSTAKKTSNLVGSREGHDISAGDIVKFRDITGAAMKYSQESPDCLLHGFFRRIPRMITQGFDMNVFKVKDTSTKAMVKWQDGTVTQEYGNSLVPYINVDDHEVWVGEVVSLKSAEEKNDGLIHLKEVGVVQSVDANERIARVRWFDNPSVAILEERKSLLFSGALLGSISDRESSVALFDIIAHPALTKHRGDLVVIVPNSDILRLETAMLRVTRGGTLPTTLPPLGQADSTEDSQGILSSSEVRWFGEVVDLGLDGLLTIRLGGLDEPEDIKVPIQQVTVAVGDDEDFDSGTDYSTDDYGSSDYDSMSDNDEGLPPLEPIPVSETVEYEGGERLDSGDEEDWMTDDADEDHANGTKNTNATHSEKDKKMDGDIEMKDAPNEVSQPHSGGQIHETPRSGQTGLRSALQFARHQTLEPATQYGFSALEGMPLQFEVLDSPCPPSHHYRDSPPSLSSNFLRRIKREHSMLDNNLPEGIWVRTWDTRLDLLRVLILGPRGTPYELAPFLLDFKLGSDFPTSPPSVYFHSWTNGVGRINPNLYEDGKVCLSILGTWDHNNENESWNPAKSSLLQVLVSLLGLVLVEDPYYNEAGFESLVGSDETIVPARIYREKALCMAKGFIVHALSHEIGAMESVIKWLYMGKEGPRLLHEVVSSSEELLSRRNGRNKDDEDGKEPISAGAEILLKRHLPSLKSKLTEADAKP